MQRPVIGVTGPDRGGRVSWFFNRLAVRRAGGLPLRITPGRPADLERLDGLVVAGGADIDPALYGQPNVAARHVDPHRDRLEADLLRWAVEYKKPTLAICRGMQLLNVTLGGTLHQEANEVYDHFTPTSGLYRKATLRRQVFIIKKGWLSRLLGTGKKSHLVNSLHHQAVAEVAPPLEVVAVDEHGMVQAVEFEEKDFFALGVQWHPELMPHSKVQTAFFRALIAACRPGRPGRGRFAPAD
ncbi:MAG TPA: gamma-glutamyl-gamma-aminobutyrate hydrolase family protein [Gemmataceae bacterium]